MAYSSFSVVFGEQPSTAKWNILGTNDAHFYDFLGDNTAWQSWTPTLANLTIGGGTVTAYYTQVGKTVFCRLSILLSGSTMGTAPTFTLPVAADTTISKTAGTTRNYCMLEDASAGSYLGVFTFVADDTMQIQAITANGTYASGASITSTVPMTWANGDYIAATFFYEAA